MLEKGALIIAMTEQGAGLLGSSALVPQGKKYLHNQRLGLVDKIDSEAYWTAALFFTDVVFGCGNRAYLIYAGDRGACRERRGRANIVDLYFSEGIEVESTLVPRRSARTLSGAPAGCRRRGERRLSRTDCARSYHRGSDATWIGTPGWPSIDGCRSRTAVAASSRVADGLAKPVRRRPAGRRFVDQPRGHGGVETGWRVRPCATTGRAGVRHAVRRSLTRRLPSAGFAAGRGSGLRGNRSELSDARRTQVLQ